MSWWRHKDFILRGSNDPARSCRDVDVLRDRADNQAIVRHAVLSWYIFPPYRRTIWPSWSRLTRCWPRNSFHYWPLSFGMSECCCVGENRLDPWKRTRKLCNVVSIYFSNAVMLLKIAVMSSLSSLQRWDRNKMLFPQPAGHLWSEWFVCFHVGNFP